MDWPGHPSPPPLQLHPGPIPGAGLPRAQTSPFQRGPRRAGGGAWGPPHSLQGSSRPGLRERRTLRTQAVGPAGLGSPEPRSGSPRRRCCREVSLARPLLTPLPPGWDGEAAFGARRLAREESGEVGDDEILGVSAARPRSAPRSPTRAASVHPEVECPERLGPKGFGQWLVRVLVRSCAAATLTFLPPPTCSL